MRQYRGLIVLALVTVAALATGLVLASRDDSSAAAPDEAPAATTQAAATVEEEAPASPARSDGGKASRTGLVYDERARKIKPKISAQAYIAVEVETGRVLIAHTTARSGRSRRSRR